MIKYSKIILDNGLTVVNHRDPNSKISLFNLMYHVGSKHEESDKTGLAHYLEHMMFEGTPEVEAFDKVLSSCGGNSNAFTSPDVTNYYQSLPSVCLETAFWLESDRMKNLSLTSERFDVQKKVVIEEFKQRYLSQPYGDVWHVLRSFCYPESSYNWPTIGKTVEGIQLLEADQLRAFFHQYYLPNNGHLVVGGDHSDDEVFGLAEKWFGGIEPKQLQKLEFKEPRWLEKEVLEVQREVSQDVIYICFQGDTRNSEDYITTSIMVDMVGSGRSSYLYQKVVVEDKLLDSVSLYHTGGFEDSLIVLSGRLKRGSVFEDIENKLIGIIKKFPQSDSLKKNLERVKNQEASSHAFEMVNLQSRVLSLAYGSILGNIDEVNQEQEKIANINLEDVKKSFEKYINTDIYKAVYYKSI